MKNNPHILIIGDIMLDQYVSGKVERISPEAPVPVLKVEMEWNTLGGAANVAANASALGGKATLVGLVGNDVSAELIQDMCSSQGINPQLFKTSQPTITKTRVVAGQQIVRIDREEKLRWSSDSLEKLKKTILHLVEENDIILLSDYAKGTLSDDVLTIVFDACTTLEKRVLVDPKRKIWSAYQGAYLITPNLAELQMTKAGKGITNDDNQVVKACNVLRKEFDIKNIVATRSSYGMTVCAKHGILNIPTRALEVYDVSGAGDTVLAAFGVGLAEGSSISESAFMANAAAGIVVSKRGTAVVHRSELHSFLKGGNKLISAEEIAVFKSMNENRKMVFTNGCFDVLHQGHRKLLQEARTLGDLLVVGLNSDDSISRLKGATRPMNKQQERVDALAALPWVDAIMVFNEDTPYELISGLKPQILVKGGDYLPNEIVGNNLVDQVVVIPLVEGISTTKLIS